MAQVVAVSGEGYTRSTDATQSRTDAA